MVLSNSCWCGKYFLIAKNTIGALVAHIQCKKYWIYGDLVEECVMGIVWEFWLVDNLIEYDFGFVAILAEIACFLCKD